MEVFEKVQKPWGYYEVHSYGDNFKIKTLVINPHSCTSYQQHQNREEIWLIRAGQGTIISGNWNRPVKMGDVIRIEKGNWHQIINGTANHLVIHEIQHGGECNEEDIVRQ